MASKVAERPLAPTSVASLGVLPHEAFRQLVEVASYDSFKLDPRVRVASKTAFGAMQSYIAELYDGLEVQATFEDPAGRIFDCVPIEQQPSLRGHSGPVAQPPDLGPVLQGREPVIEHEPRRLVIDNPRIDRHGNAMKAPDGTIPIRRITLDELTRFRTLQEFFQKQPIPRTTATSGPVTGIIEEGEPTTPSADVAQNHRYAYTIQTVDNIGAHNSISVYAPAINADQIFSLAQHWYAAGSGAGHQTLEVGWQVYPQKYGHSLPVLFIYYTPDNYATGAYNLDAPAFVQTNSAWTIGGALSPVSTVGGQQMEIEITVYLHQGNWWIYLGGVQSSNAVGYYPTSIYNGGAMATKATEILFGGETVTRQVSWPGMGSGSFANGGWQQSAYQRNIYYFPPTGGAQWANLTAQQPSAPCYTLNLASAAAPWGVYFFFGGPGGGNC